MKKISRSVPVLAAALLVGSVVSAHADTTPGWYGAAGAGANFTPDSSTSAPGGNRDADFHTGYNIEGSGGYSFTNGLRAEGELYYSTAVIDKMNSTAPGSGGALTNNILFANGLYDWNNGTMFTPYVGAGVGIDAVNADNIGPLVHGQRLGGYAFQLAYQGIAGVSAQVDYNWAVTADYRYIATPDPLFDRRSGGTGRMENASHNAMIGVRYSFGEPAPVMKHTAVPTSYHPPATKSYVAPVAQSYQVFFDFNKAELTPEAKTILASAAKDFRAGKYVRIVVTGHTDTVGTKKYNDALSLKRAKAVKAELIKDGVAVSAVKTEGVGKDGLMVPTADGVREAQNRRAEIVFEGK